MKSLNMLRYYDDIAAFVSGRMPWNETCIERVLEIFGASDSESYNMGYAIAGAYKAAQAGDVEKVHRKLHFAADILSSLVNKSLGGNYLDPYTISVNLVNRVSCRIKEKRLSFDYFSST